MKSELNSDCPAGYGLIEDSDECFSAYDGMKGENGWTGGHLSGTWGHVMQCGVHIAYSQGAGNGNTIVHFKTNNVDGSSPSEDWVHICKKQGKPYINLGKGTCSDSAGVSVYDGGYSWIGVTATTSECRAICDADATCVGYQQSGTQSGVGGTANCVKHRRTATKLMDNSDGWEGSVCWGSRQVL